MTRLRAASALARLVIPVVAGAGLLAATALPASAGAVAASVQSSGTPAEPCPGVTVVVDYGSLGGGTALGCANDSPTSAAQALLQAGFSQTRVQLQPGFICRIDGKPASDPCVQTPPQDAYWSFWTAPDGKSWSYANVGVDGYTPHPGTAVGFAFGAGTAPSVLAPAQTAQTASASAHPSASTAASPQPTRATATTGAAATPAGAAASPTRAASGPVKAPSTGAAGTSPTGATAPGYGATAATSAAPTPSTPGPAALPPTGPGTAGGIAPGWLGAGLVAALAVAAVLRARRARSRR